MLRSLGAEGFWFSAKLVHTIGALIIRIGLGPLYYIYIKEPPK